MKKNEKMYVSVSTMLLILAGILLGLDAMAGWSDIKFGILFIVAVCLIVIAFYVLSWLFEKPASPQVKS